MGNCQLQAHRTDNPLLLHDEEHQQRVVQRRRKTLRITNRTAAASSHLALQPVEREKQVSAFVRSRQRSLARHSCCEQVQQREHRPKKRRSALCQTRRNSTNNSSGAFLEMASTKDSLGAFSLGTSSSGGGGARGSKRGSLTRRPSLLSRGRVTPLPSVEMSPSSSGGSDDNNNKKSSKTQRQQRKGSMTTIVLDKTPSDTETRHLPLRKQHQLHPSMCKQGPEADKVDLRSSGGAGRHHRREKSSSTLSSMGSLRERWISRRWKSKKSVGDVQIIEACLAQHFVFHLLSDQHRRDLIQALQATDVYPAGTLLWSAGDPADFFSIIKTGTVRLEYYQGASSILLSDSASERDRRTRDVQSGTPIDELSCLYGLDRPATARAQTDVVLFTVSKEVFVNLVGQDACPSHRECSESIELLPAKRLLERAPAFSGLRASTTRELAKQVTTVNFKAGDVIVRKGDRGELVYLLDKGQVRLSDVELNGASFRDRILSAGDCFGWSTILYDQPRSFSAIALTNVVALCITRDTLKDVLAADFDPVRHGALDASLIPSLPLFEKASLQRDEVHFLKTAMFDVNFKQGEFITSDNNMIESGVYVVRKGKVKVTNADDRNSIVLGPCAHFGGESMIPDENWNIPEKANCHATVQALEDCVIGFLSRESILNVLSRQRIGPNAIIDRSNPDESSWHSRGTSSKELPDLVYHRMIGRGGYGKVWLVSSNEDARTPFALKTISKRKILDNDVIQDLKREKEIMKALNSLFITQLHTTYQSETEVFLLMQFVHGGELNNLIHTKTRDGISEDMARFYGACIWEALDYMHSKGFINRDVKPSNVLINFDGYPVIIDLGFARKLRWGGRAYTSCGTPAYVAPEVLQPDGYNRSADYWSFGICLYEMLYGKTPFYDRGMNACQVYHAIANREPSFASGTSEDPNVSQEAIDLMGGLLEKDPMKRLGVALKDKRKVRDHTFFHKIEWDRLREKDLKAPWLPEVKSPMDLSQYPEPRRSVKGGHLGGPALTPKQQAMFKGF